MRQDKDQLEQVIGALEERLDKIKTQNDLRDKIFDDMVAKNQTLEADLAARQSEIEQLYVGIEEEKKRKDDEIDEVKATAANTIRSLQDMNNSHKMTVLGPNINVNNVANPKQKKSKKELE